MNLILLINIKNKHIMVFGFLSNFILLQKIQKKCSPNSKNLNSNSYNSLNSNRNRVLNLIVCLQVFICIIRDGH